MQLRSSGGRRKKGEAAMAFEGGVRACFMIRVGQKSRRSEGDWRQER